MLVPPGKSSHIAARPGNPVRVKRRTAFAFLREAHGAPHSGTTARALLARTDERGGHGSDAVADSAFYS
ncbi:MAG TPA: hypothetical protein VOA41_20305 [Candidatus Dormibacteraeota bacterium]|nr:hypothetical protein [Candidatus Dormibacteraeota bacterium]